LPAYDSRTCKLSKHLDILEQIERLNGMVDFHKNKSGEKSMQRQYEDMRQEWLEKELEEMEKKLRAYKRKKVQKVKVGGAGKHK
jgi:hypothetical protein